MKITSLLENTAHRADMRTEHGLSLFIETNRHKILFDMGQSELFAENAVTLGIALSEVDIAVLSHGHYDHGGGMRRFLSENDRAPIYLQKDAFLPHYHGEERYIGLDTDLEKDSRVIRVSEALCIDEELSLHPCDWRVPPALSAGLTEQTRTGFIPDDFRHEQYLLIEEDGKRILISGCSHAGILNIVDRFSPDVLIGGFHFFHMPTGNALADIAQKLNAYPTEYYTCHCTGIEQYAFLKELMPRLRYLSCGESIIV